MGRNLLLATISGIAASAMVLAAYLAYNKDITTARKRISQAKVINTTQGQIQYADVGKGKPVLAIHGAGGGFDQGLFTAREILGDDMENNYRVIAPSRFGYLGTPIPADGDASPAAAADAHAALIEALGIENKVIVVGVSAGALSSMQFAIRYPDRVVALILEVPSSWKPPTDIFQGDELMANNFIMNRVVKSDFIMWTFVKVAKDQMVSFLGVPPELQKKMTPEERRQVDELISLIFPVSERLAGIVNEGIIHQKLERYDLESIHVPTLIIDAKDVSTFPGSKYTAEHVPNAKLVAFETGGHLLIGHREETQAAVKSFLKQYERLELIS